MMSFLPVTKLGDQLASGQGVLEDIENKHAGVWDKWALFASRVCFQQI